MDDKRYARIEDESYGLLEDLVKILRVKVKNGDCAAADIQAAIAFLKHLKIDLEAMTHKGPDPDLPDVDDLPFTEGDLVSIS